MNRPKTQRNWIRDQNLSAKKSLAPDGFTGEFY